MTAWIYATVKALLLPPGANIVALLGAFALRRRASRCAAWLGAVGLASLVLFSVPWVSERVADTVEVYPNLGVEGLSAHAPQAIVILAGGRLSDSPEYGGDVPSMRTLVRLRYGARLHRTTGLPVAVSGGRVYDEALAEAKLMQEVLAEDLGTPVRWIETRSRNTAENANLTRGLLAAEGIDRVVLVTEAVHMRRAVRAFERAGFAVAPAPTYFQSARHRLAARDRPATWRTWLGWLPDAQALQVSRDALHEWLGLAWYALRYGAG